MDFKTFLLVASLVSAITAVPTGPRTSQCASSTCDQPQKFFYELGRKYEYDYEVETITTISNIDNEAANVKVKALVAVQPVSPCEFLLSLSQVTLDHSSHSETFAREVMKHPIRFAFHDGRVEHVCPSTDEAAWVVNFKKGILSSFQSSMSWKEKETRVITETDVSGTCETTYTIKEARDLETILIERLKNPSECSHRPQINQKLSSLGFSFDSLVGDIPIMESKQECMQTITKDIISSVMCEEEQTFQPFKSRASGATTHTKTKLKLKSIQTSSTPRLENFIARNDLLFEIPNSESSNPTMGAVQTILMSLEGSSENGIKKEVPALFSNLVSSLRSLTKVEIQTLYDSSHPRVKYFITDALPLVGTSASSGVFVNLILKGEVSEKERDVWISSLAFVKRPSLEMLTAIEPLLTYALDNKASLGISSMIHNYCLMDNLCQNKRIIQAIISNFESRLGISCRATSEEEKLTILYALKSLGNAGHFVNANNILNRCIIEENPIEIRVAAIDAWRRVPCNKWNLENTQFLATFSDRGQDNEIRIASYLALMRCPTQQLMNTLKEILTSEGVNHVSSFVWTHLTNLHESAAPEKQLIKNLIGEDFFKKKFSPESLKLSRNFESSFYLKEQEFGASVESNVIFSSNSILPHSTMLNLTIDLFGESINLFEVGGRIEGLESYIEKFFGPDGYYPEDTMAAIVKNLRKKDQKEDTILEPYLIEQETDEASGSYYLKFLGNEMLYHNFKGIENSLPEMKFSDIFEVIRELASKGSVDFTRSYNLIDSDFTFPTIAGLPIRLKLNGKAVIGFKLDGTFKFEDLTSMIIEGKFHPSAAITLDASMLVDASVTKAGVKLASTMHSSTSVSGKAIIDQGNLIDFLINVPEEKIEIFDVHNEFFLIEDGEETSKNIPVLEDQRCYGVEMLGMQLCSENDIAPYSGIFGSRNKRFYLQKTDSHYQYAFKYSNIQNKMTFLIDMAGSQSDKKWSVFLNRQSGQYELDVHLPTLISANGKVSYLFNDQKNKVEASLSTDKFGTYAANFHIEKIIEEKQLKKVTGEALIQFSHFEREIIKVNGKLTYEADAKLLNVQLDQIGIIGPPFSAQFNFNRKSEENSLGLSVKSSPFDLSISGSLGQLNSENGATLLGTYRLYNRPPKSFTTQLHYQNQRRSSGMVGSVSLDIEDLDFKTDFNLEMKENYVSAKLMGKYLHVTWNIEQSFSCSLTEQISKFVLNHKSSIPTADWKGLWDYKILNTKEQFLMESSLKTSSIEKEKRIIWNYGKDFLIDSSLTTPKDSMSGKLKIERKQDSSYAWQIDVNMSDMIKKHSKGSYEQVLSKDGISMKLDYNCSIETSMLPLTNYKFEWFVNANESQLQMDVNLSANDHNSFLTLNGQKNYFKIDSNLIKPFTAEAKITGGDEGKRFSIISMLDGTDFEVLGEIGLHKLQANFKYKEKEIKILAQLKTGSIEIEAQLSPIQRFTLWGHYTTGKLDVGFETPIMGWEKQEITLTYMSNESSFQSQAQITFSNINYITFSIDMKKEADISMISHILNLKLTSIFENFKTIKFSFKHLMHGMEISTKIEGQWNSKIIKGNLEATQKDYQTIFGITLKSPYTEDFSLSFKLTIPPKELSGSLDIVYGTKISKIFLQSSISDASNLSIHLNCSGPFLPEILINASLKTNDVSKTLQVKGKYENKEISLIGKCEAFKTGEKHTCKFDLDILKGSMNIFSGSYTQEIGSENDFQIDIKLSSLLLSDQSVKGHIGGKLTSLASTILTGYIFGPGDFTGRLDINHKIMKDKLVTELNIEQNSSKISINLQGDINLKSKEFSLQGEVKSTIESINGYKLVFQHQIQNKARETSIVLSKENFNFYVYHSIFVKDVFNWINIIKINDNYSLRSENIKLDGFMKHITRIKLGEKTIDFTIEGSYRKRQLYLTMMLDTPWSSLIQVTAVHKKEGSKRQIEIKTEYAQEKSFLINSEYEVNKNSKHGSFKISNKDWNLMPLQIEFRLKTGVNTKFESTLQLNQQLKGILQIFRKEETFGGNINIKFNDKSGPMSLIGLFSQTSNVNRIYLEYNRDEKYTIDLTSSQDQPRKIITKLTIPCLSHKSFTNSLIYDFTNYPFYLILESDFEEQEYYLETRVNEGEGFLKTLSPSFNGNLTLKWQISEEEKSIRLDLKSPFQFIEDSVLKLNLKSQQSKVMNLEFRYGTQWMKLRGEIREGFILFRTQSTAEEWKNLEAKVNLSHSEISGQVSRNNDIITFKGLGNFDLLNGEGTFHFSLPYYGFEENEIIVEYSNTKSMKNVEIYANIGSKIWEFKLLSKLIDISSMQVIMNIQSQQEFKKITVETMIRPASIKINGKIDEYHFESSMEFTAEQLEKTELKFQFISNIPYFELFSIQAYINMHQMPYKTFLQMKSGSETQTYSLTFDLRDSNMAIEIQTPIKSFEIIKIKGNHKIEDKKMEVIFSCQAYTDIYTISGLIDVSKPVQKIEFNLILPPRAEINNIKLMANCTFQNTPSLNFLLEFGDKIYKANIHSKLSASEGNGFLNVILNDMVDLNVNVSYNLQSPISHFLTEIEYNGMLDRYYIQKRQTSNEFSLDIETPIKKFRKLFIIGQYSEMGITNIISGKIINNDDVYHFEGKVTQIKNGAEIQLSVPYDQYESQTFPGNFKVREQHIKIFISYQLDETNAFVKINTPFESLSYLAIGTRLENESNSSNRLIYIHRNSEHTEVNVAYNLLSSLMKFDLKASLNGPSSNSYGLEVFYDFISQEKKGGFIVKNGETVSKYSAEILYTGIDHGYVKVYTPYPNFKRNGFEYKFKAQDIANIEAFIAITQETEEIVFGVTSRYNPNEITFMLQTPFVNYKTFGLESQVSLEEKHGKVRLELGIYKFLIEGNLELDDFGIHIETSAENFKIFKFSSKYECQSLKKSALLELIYNELKYELNGDVTTSYRTPQISFKFISPLEFLSVFEFTAKLDIVEPSEFLEVNLKVNAIKYSLSFGYELEDLHGLIKLQAITPIPKWTSFGLDVKVDLSSEAKNLFISLKKENITKILSLSAKSMDDEIAFDLQSPFETSEDLKSHFFVKRNKRSIESNIMNDKQSIIKNFNSLKIVITSPFEKAKDIHFELTRNAKGMSLSYKRNNNQIFMNFNIEKKGKSFDIKVTSEIPGWELLALAGRLDGEEILGYIRGQRNSDMVHISGSGKFGNKFGSISITAKTPFEKYKEVTTVLEYHFRRRTFRFESNSNSSNFHILIKYQREWEVDIFVPHNERDTQINGKLAWFNGNLTGQSRFSILRSFSLNYALSIERNIIKANVMIERNGKKVFEHEFEFNVEKTKIHSMTHIRRGENYSMLHFHLDKWTKSEFVFKRNNKEFSITLDGSSGLPNAGTITYTILNSFREVPRKVYGTIEVDRNSSPKKITLLVNWHTGAQYTFFLSYNTNLADLRTGDFVLRTVTPNRKMTPWKNISGEWKINKGILEAVIRAGPMEYRVNGKFGLLEGDLEIESKHSQMKFSAKWKFKSRGNDKDLYMKVGIGERFVMWKLMGKIENYPFDGGNIKGAFLASRFMKDEFVFTAQWKKEGGVVKGNGTYKYGNKSGTHTLKTLKRNPQERSLILEWEATTSRGPIVIDAKYNLSQKMVDIKITRANQEILLIKFILNNLSVAFSENPINFNIPLIGQGEITIKHDFRNKLSKSLKIIGTINGRGISYIFEWTRDNKLTLFNLKGDINSALFGKANVDAHFDIRNFDDAKGNFIYSRNNNKNIKLEWSRKKEATRLADKMTFESHFSLLRRASVYVNADWSQGFEANAGIQVNNKDIRAQLKITPRNTVATITTPFPQFGNIRINIDYNLQKAKSKSLTFKYTRGENVVEMNFELNTPNKKSGKLSLSLTTPFEVLKTFNINAEWKKGVFNAVYTRNDITVNIEGTAEIKINKSSFDIKFVPPNSAPVELAFSYDLDSFVKGSGKKAKDLINFKLQIDRQHVNFIVKGYRTPDHIFIEMNGGSSLEKMKEFHIKLDSELNLNKREGLLSIQIGDFHYNQRNTFERLPQGFYLKSKAESSLTSLPGLIFGLGHERDSYMVTLGYGEDREITITLKGKDNFKRGFTGTIDIPRRGIHDLEYTLNYSFNSQDEFKIILDIKLNEGENIKAEILYNSSGVQSRLSSSMTGLQILRVKRSLSDGKFMADIGMDNNRLTIEGDYTKNAWKKGFKIEGEILGEKVLIAGFLNSNSISDSEAKFIIQTPFELFKDLGGNLKIKSSNGKFKGNLDLNVLYPISLNVDIDFDDRKLKGDINLKLNQLVYNIKCDYKFNNANQVLDGVIYIQTPHAALERILIESNITSLNSKIIDAHFTIDHPLNPCSLHVMLKRDMPVFSSDIGIKFGTNNELKIVADYSLLKYPLSIKGFSSVHSNSKLIFNSNLELNFKTINDFHANHKVNFGENCFKGLIKMEVMEGTIKGKAMGILLENHTFEIKLDLPTHLKKALIEISYKNGEDKYALNFNLETDTTFSKYTVDFATPTFLRSSLNLTMHREPTTLKALLQTPIGQIKFNIFLDRSHTESSVETKLVGEANFSYFGNELINLDVEILRTPRAGDIKIKVNGEQNYMFYGKFENIEELYNLQVNVEAPFIPGKKGSIYISYDGSEKFKLYIESFIFDNINNLYIDIRNDSIFFNCVSPTIPTGMVSFEGKLVLYTLPDVAFKLMFAEGNAQNTWEVDGNINLTTSPISKSVDLKIITPYKHYRKMEFGLSYVEDDLMHLLAFAKPFNLEGEVFYGIQATTINAGLKVQTGNEEFSLTKVEASVPLDNFGPEFYAYFQGIDYNIKTKTIKTENKSEFSLHTKNIFTLMPFNIEAVEISLLTKAPYEFDALLGRKNNPDVKFGLIFDSSFLYPLEKLHKSCIFGFLPTMIL